MRQGLLREMPAHTLGPHTQVSMAQAAPTEALGNSKFTFKAVT